ncbi:hypothetical protein BCV64_12280 [Cylindrospermopsis raciborskii MVCC14]|nr:hypothetical protein BCV64_12280 [Cylindrospermopsis raciborskii MVCC14]
MVLNNPHFYLSYKKATIPLNVLLYNMFNLKAPLFKGGVGGDPMVLNNPHFYLPYKKATIPLNVLLYNMFNLKALLFKGGWGGSDGIKQPTFLLIL